MRRPSVEAVIHKAIAPFLSKKKQGYAMGRVREALAELPDPQTVGIDEKAFFGELRKHADYDEADPDVGLSDCWNASSQDLRKAIAASTRVDPK